MTSKEEEAKVKAASDVQTQELAAMQGAAKRLDSSKTMVFPDMFQQNNLTDDESDFAQMRSTATTFQSTINNVLENQKDKVQDFPVMKSSNDGAIQHSPLPRLNRQLFI